MWAVMNKRDRIQEHMDNLIREMEILRKNYPKKMLEKKHYNTSQKLPLIDIFNLTQLRKESEIQNISIDSLKTEKQREQRFNNTEYSRPVGQLKMYNIQLMGIPEDKTERKRTNI